MQVEPARVHDDEYDCQHQWHRERDHDTGAPAEREEAHQQDDAERLDECSEEFRHRSVDDVWLIRDLRDFDPDRKLGGDRLHRLLEVLAERQNVAAILHRDAKAERRTAALAHQKVGGSS